LALHLKVRSALHEKRDTMQRVQVIECGEPGVVATDLIPPALWSRVCADHQRAIPALAKNPGAAHVIEVAASRVPTRHRLLLGDARDTDDLKAESVHLVLTSPPYWTLKAYPSRPGQLAEVADYESFLDELDSVWRGVYRALVPGGRLVIVVGDVCLSRRRSGRHAVVPLHASIQERCRRIGFDNLAPIIWHKIANARFEVENGFRFLGKPYEPNAVIKNDVEYILFQRKPGGYRQPGLAERLLSVIPESRHRVWFQQIWALGGASTRRHPAPYPLPLAERLIRMFSFVGDTVLDPFMGTGTTNLAAGRWGRNSVGIEIEPSYFEMACARVRQPVPLKLVVSPAGAG
jgi:DNA modification methylase